MTADERRPAGSWQDAADVTTRIDLRIAAALVAVLLVGVAGLGLAVHAGNPLPIDTALAPGIMAWYPPAATDLFDTLGSLPVFAAVMVVGAVAALASSRRGTVVSFVLGLCGEIVTTAVKLVVDRPRPPAGVGIDAFVTTASYPSGHTVRAVLMGGLIVAAFAWQGRRGGVRFVATLAGLAFAALVGLARIASGQHWPTDVIGGLLLGGAWLTICLIVADRLERRRRRPPPATG
jgi:membrane-associated phospholipid phosphatase